MPGRCRRALRKAALAAAMLLLPLQAGAADDFYKGKTIKIVVGFGPGGGYDLYARLLGKYLGQHIPGQPNVIVENLSGAGSIKAANYVYGIAPKDGTVIATINQTIPMFQLLGGEGTEFKTHDIQWLGSMASSNEILFTWHTSDVKTIDDAKKHEVVMGAITPTSDSYIYPTVINAILGTKFKVVNGYPDGNDVNLAVERGEVAGRGGNSWSSLNSNRRAWIDQKKINLILQVGFSKEPDLPDVALLSDLAKDAAAKQVVDVISVPVAIGYATWLAPGVPADRMAILRKAFDETVTDPALLAEAAQRNVTIRPQGGAHLEAQVKRISNTPQEVLDRVAKTLDWRK
jgi:tripartite-type tricarboxylate transporter receptor subunit TctC